MNIIPHRPHLELDFSNLVASKQNKGDAFIIYIGPVRSGMFYNRGETLLRHSLLETVSYIESFIALKCGYQFDFIGRRSSTTMYDEEATHQTNVYAIFIFFSYCVFFICTQYRRIAYVINSFQ